MEHAGQLSLMAIRCANAIDCSAQALLMKLPFTRNLPKGRDRTEPPATWSILNLRISDPHLYTGCQVMSFDFTD